MINDPIPPLQMAAVQGLWTIQLLVTSSLITATFHKYMDKGKRSRSVCTVWDDRNSDFTCNQLIVGVVSMNKKIIEEVICGRGIALKAISRTNGLYSQSKIFQRYAYN